MDCCLKWAQQAMNAGFRSEKGKHFSCGMLSISQGRQLCAFNGFSAGQSWNIWKLSVLPAGPWTLGRVFRKRGREQNGRIWGTSCGSPLIWSESFKDIPLVFLAATVINGIEVSSRNTESKKLKIAKPLGGHQAHSAGAIISPTQHESFQTSPVSFLAF